MKKILYILPVLLIILCTSVFAYVDATFYFSEDNVEARAYTCLDAGCNQVSTTPFGYSGSTTNGELTIIFPSTLQSPYGYALFFVSDGRIPVEGISTLHSGGDNNHYPITVDVEFHQVANCASTIDEFTITNDVYANEPLQVGMMSSLDATTRSAFEDALNNVGYVPPEFIDEHYSADITVTLEILDDQSDLLAVQNEYFQIFMSEAAQAEFTWIPLVEGWHTAIITTTVTDNQCAANTPLSSGQDFYVEEERPTNECYSILNGLHAVDPNPIVGDTVTMEYDKISNYADPEHELFPVGTAVTYTVRDPDGGIVYTDDFVLGANPNPDDPVLFDFSWVPAMAGVHEVEVVGQANSGLCDGLDNPVRVLREDVMVDPIPSYEVTYIISDDQSGARIQGAVVSSNGQTAVTDAQGTAVIEGYVNGPYTYTVSHTLYNSISGDFVIANSDKIIARAMHRANTAPTITNIPDVHMLENTVHEQLDLDLYVQDEEDLDSELVWTHTNPTNIDVYINPTTHVVRFTPTTDFTGSRTVTFTVTDTGGLTDSDAMAVTVEAVNDAPVISGLPDQVLDEGDTRNNAFNLNDYASDPDNTDSQLTYSIVGATNGGCGVTIDANDNVDINPATDFNGVCDITIRVTDPSGLYDEDTFRVTINSINDAPVYINFLPDVTLPQGDTRPDEFNLNDYVYDVENDELTFEITQATNGGCGVSIDAQDNVDVMPDPAFYGQCDITIRVTDVHGAYAEDTFTVTVIPLIDTVEIECQEVVIVEHDQICVATAYSNGQPVTTANIDFVFSNGDVLSCQADDITGGCGVDHYEGIVGEYDVQAFASAPGYIDGQSEVFDYLVWEERYEVLDLQVFEDPGFTTERYEFYRGEDMYVQFTVRDLYTGEIVDDLVSQVTLFSPIGGGMADLDSMGPSINGIYQYELTPIPITHYFIGESEVYGFVFNFEDESGGQSNVSVLIMNNPPVITAEIPDQYLEVGETVVVDLAPYEYDVEDSGEDLTWTVTDVDGNVIDAVIIDKTLVITGVEEGVDYITVTLTDLDGASDSQEVRVEVVAESFECSNGIDDDGDGLVDMADPGCSDPTDDDESDGTTQCQDSVDNDGDGLVDMADPGCDSPQDDDESDGPVTCYTDIECGTPSEIGSCNGLDYTNTYTEPVCVNPGLETSYCDYEVAEYEETCSNICSADFGCDYTECSDEVDNDWDGLIDLADPGCDDYFDDDESDGTSECQDGIDNDGDGYIDYPADWGCDSPQDDSEINEGDTQCTDGIDNDDDGLTDMDDPGCEDPSDDDEDEPAVWDRLADQTILEDSPDGTLVYANLANMCNDPDDNEVVAVVSAHANYDLDFVGDDLLVFNLVQDYTGVETVVVSCNGVTADFELTVAPIGDAPVFSELPDQELYEDTVLLNAFNLNDYAMDPDGDDLSFHIIQVTSDISTANPNPCGVSIDANDNIDIMPIPDFNGECIIIVRAEDPTGLYDEATFRVTVLPVPDCPVIVSEPVENAMEGVLYTYDVEAIDVDGDDLTYYLTDGPADMIIDENTGLIEWTPDVGEVGDHHVTVAVTDGGCLITQYYTVTVSFNPGLNHAPEIISEAVTTASDGELYEYDVEAIDVDGDDLTYSLMVAPAGMTIDSETGLIEWVPTQAQVGSHDVTVVVSDGELTDEQSYIINVGDIEHAPIITSTPITTIYVEDPRDFEIDYVYDVEAYDPDGDVLTYSLAVAPEGMTIDSETGLIEWTIDEDTPLSNYVVVEVTDGMFVVQQAFYITIEVPKEVSSPRGKLRIDQILFDGDVDNIDTVEPGSDMWVSVAVRNLDYYDADDLSITVTIPELGVRRRVGPFDLDARTSTTKSTMLEIPSYTAPGYYDFRISVSNDKYRRTKYREIIIE